MIRAGGRRLSPPAILLASLLVSLRVTAQPMPTPPPQAPAPAPTSSTAPTIAPTAPVSPGAVPPTNPGAARSPVAAAPSPAPIPSPAELPPTAPTSETPPAEPKFGDAGEIVVSGQLSASLGHLSYSDSPASTTSASLQPAFDYFVSRNISLGTSVFIQYSDNTSGLGIETKNLAYGVYARVGDNIPLGDVVSLRPIGSLGVWSMHSKVAGPFGGSVTIGGTSVPIGSDITETVVVLEIFAPLLLHPARHLFLGLGPDWYTDLSHTVDTFSNHRTFIGISSTVGGWF